MSLFHYFLIHFDSIQYLIQYIKNFPKKLIKLQVKLVFYVEFYEDYKKKRILERGRPPSYII